MTTKRWDGSAFVDLTTCKRWDGSAWVDLTVAKRWDGSAWVDIPLPGGGGGPLAVTISRDFIQKAEIDPEPAPSFKNLQTATVTVTATGGTAPYTYAWTRVSGDSAILCTQPALAATQFQANMAKNSDRIATWRCTVTDDAAAVRTVDVQVLITYSNNL